MITRAHRIPSLDGLRAVSITLVVLAHLLGTRGFPLADRSVDGVMMGYLGVTVFFVISGFLISGLLFEEEIRTGRISILQFYMRRMFRIFPAYYTIIAVVALLASTGCIRLNPWDLTAALTYTMNYHPTPAWYLGHSWSLAVEEQFYLLWPAALLALGRRRGLIGAAAFVVAAPFIRLILLQLGAPYYNKAIIGNSFETTGDAIAVGCVLAGVRDWFWKKSWYRRCLTTWWFAAPPVLVLLMFSLHRHPRIFACAYSVAIVCIAVVIDGCTRLPGGAMGRVLNSRLLVYVGGMSYSFYLWQQPFLNRKSSAVWASFPLNLLLAAAFALISYQFVEKPWLALRRLVEARLWPKGSDLSSRPIVPWPVK
jgi:peptidoglycan/LPS O-acetylase OafA/YrhL